MCEAVRRRSAARWEQLSHPMNNFVSSNISWASIPEFSSERRSPNNPLLYCTVHTHTHTHTHSTAHRGAKCSILFKTWIHRIQRNPLTLASSSMALMLLIPPVLQDLTVPKQLTESQTRINTARHRSQTSMIFAAHQRQVCNLHHTPAVWSGLGGHLGSGKRFTSLDFQFQMFRCYTALGYIMYVT